MDRMQLNADQHIQPLTFPVIDEAVACGDLVQGFHCVLRSSKLLRVQRSTDQRTATFKLAYQFGTRSAVF